MTTVGPNYPGSQASVMGSGSFPWNTPTNAASDNGSYTTTNCTQSTPSEILKLTSFGFSLGGGVTSIDGIVLEIKRRKTGMFGNNRDNSIKLTKDGSNAVGSEKADTATNWPTTAAYASYGGASDLWGASWSQSDVEASTFGVFIKAAGADSSFSQAEIDTARITVYYTTSGVQRKQYRSLLGVGI